MCVIGPTRLYFEHLKILNFEFNADPDPAFQSDADPDSASNGSRSGNPAATLNLHFGYLHAVFTILMNEVTIERQSRANLSEKNTI